MNEHPLPPAEFNAIYARVPRLTVELVINTADGIVLTKRSIDPCKGQWHIPGGTVRFGEPLPGAVRRIARNELGVAVSVGRLVGYIEYPEMMAAGYRGWPVGIAFETHVVGGTLTAGDQTEQIGHFRDIPADTITEQARFLSRYLEECAVAPH